MSSPNYTRYSWPLAIAALVIILAGCFAPWLFTLPGTPDFTNTGEIGDTIGGTMSPFVGIAGVIMTFVAFMMQVRANEIQREQLGKTFLMKDVESMIEDRRAMELMKIDVDNAISDIERRCRCIDEFCTKIKHNPFDEVPLMRPSVTSLSRYQSIDRNRVFNAFKAFLGEDGTKLFQNTYIYLDYYYESVQYINDTLDKNWEKNVERIKSKISELYRDFCKIIDKRISLVCDTAVKELLMKFKEEGGDIIVNGEPDIKRLSLLIDSPHKGIEKELSMPERVALDESLEAIKAENLSQSKAMRDASDKFRGDDCLGVLKEISERIKKALEEHTEEEIRNKFEGKI